MILCAAAVVIMIIIALLFTVSSYPSVNLPINLAVIACFHITHLRCSRGAKDN